jgi:type 2 lantibiotic biosynthesis protein LanM
MSLSKAALAEIVARSSTFDERLQNGQLIAHLDRDEDEIDRRVNRWRDRAAKGDARLFTEVLALRGLNLESVRRGLGRVTLADPDKVPQWTNILAECLQTARTDAQAIPDRRFHNQHDPVPFERIVSPFVETAVRQLRERAGAAYARLESVAHAAIERMLLVWLAGPSSSALMLEFSLFRMNSGLASDTVGSDEIYTRFAQNMLSGGLTTFFGEYSVLARAMATLVGHWVEAMTEFLLRLDADWDRLNTELKLGAETGTVADIKAGLSDPHHGGRTVLALKFSSGAKAIYKPKSLAPESAFGHLLAWVNQQGAALPLRSPKVLACEGYGWVEYLNHTTCGDAAELERFYRRSGMLLALFHVLDATDVHAENLIAVGEFPMLVDAETLITPPLRGVPTAEQSGWSELRAAWHLDDSVVKTGMLPNWRGETSGVNYDLSGLGGVGGEEIEVPVWIGAHTDSMERRLTKVTIARNKNVPFPPEQDARPGDYLEEIVAGFENVYRILLDNCEALLAPASPLELLAKAPMRLIFRETQTYFNILKKSLDPLVMRDGADRSVDLEVLSRILCVSFPRTKHWPLVEAERRSIENMDIPAFTLFPNDRGLASGEKRITDDYFSESGYERVVKNLRTLSLERCADQCAVIRGSFYAKTLNCATPKSSAPAENSGQTNGCGTLLDAAIDIGERILRDAIRGEDGSASWVGITFSPRIAAFRYLPFSHDLLEGQAGIAIFLAALSKATNAATFHDLSCGATLPLRRFVLRALDDTGWKKLRDGKMEAALLIYPLVRLADFLNDSSLIGLACDAATLVTQDLLERDLDLGISAGTAGVLLGLLALEDVVGDGSMLDRAIRCGDHLLRSSASISGKRHALRRLFAASKEARFRESAPLHAASETWLPGLLGPGLSYLSGKHLQSEASAGESFELEMIQRLSGLRPLDSLIDGNFAVIELALEAGAQLDRPDWSRAARRLAIDTVSRAREKGGYQIYNEVPPSAACLGFIRGVAGAGYTLLRAHAPGLPSIVQWN